MNYMLQGQPTYIMVEQTQTNVLLGLLAIIGVYGLMYVLIMCIRKRKKKEGKME